MKKRVCVGLAWLSVLGINLVLGFQNHWQGRDWLAMGCLFALILLHLGLSCAERRQAQKTVALPSDERERR